MIPVIRNLRTFLLTSVFGANRFNSTSGGTGGACGASVPAEGFLMFALRTLGATESAEGFLKFALRTLGAFPDDCVAAGFLTTAGIALEVWK